MKRNTFAVRTYFQNVEKVSHIPADKRAKITDMMMKKAAEKTSVLVNSIIRTQLSKTGMLVKDDVTVKKHPSVSDLFDIPTVEAPDIEQEPKKESGDNNGNEK